MRVRELRVSAPNGLLWPINRHWSSKSDRGRIASFLPLSYIFPAITNFFWLLLKLPRGTIQTGGRGLQSKHDFNVYLCPESLQILVTAFLKAGISLIKVGSSVIHNHFLLFLDKRLLQHVHR